MAEYTQETGNSLDFSLSNTYTQQQGNTLDFELQEAIRVAVQESVDISDNAAFTLMRGLDLGLQVSSGTEKKLSKAFNEDAVVSPVSRFSLKSSYDEAVAVDSRVTLDSTFFRSYEEQFSLEDDENVYLRKALEEDFTLPDNTSATAEFFRSIHNNVTLADSDIQQLETVLTENVVGSTELDRESGFYRSLQAQLSATDEQVVTFLKNIQEAVAVNDSIDKRILLALSENLAATETERKKLARQLSEQTVLDDRVEKFLLAKRVLEEVVEADDVVETDAELERVFGEEIDLTTTATRKADIERELTQVLNISEEKSRSIYSRFTEQAGLNDSDISYLLKLAKSEEIAAADEAETLSQFAYFLSESLTVRDGDLGLFTEELAETAAVSDDYERDADFFRDVVQEIAVSENVKAAIFTVLSQAVSVNSSQSSVTMKTLIDSVTTGDDVFFKARKKLVDDVEIDVDTFREGDFFRQTAQAVNVNTDAASALPFAARKASETFEVTSDVDSAKTIFRNLDDSLAVDAEPTTLKAIFRDLTEPVNVSTDNVFKLEKPVSQSLNFSDDATSRLIFNTDGSARLEKLRKTASNLAAVRKKVAKLEKPQ